MSGSISELKIAEAEGWIRMSIMLACSVAQSRLILCDPMDYSPPHSSVHGVFQSRILEWDAISSSRGSFQFRNQIKSMCSVSPALPADSLLLSHRGSPYIVISRQLNSNTDNAPKFYVALTL